jgi:hypothetical protein
MGYPYGTLSLAAIKDAIYTWVNNVTQGVLEDPNVQVIWRNQSEPLPARPCVTLKLISGPSPTDRDPSVFIGGAGQPITSGMQMEAVLSVQVFGNANLPNCPSALQMANDINTSLFSYAQRAQLNEGGIAIQGLGKVSNLTALEETQYEERAGFEVELGLVQNIVDHQTGIVQTVNIEKTVDETESEQTVTLP